MNSDSSLILVTGASGKTGRAVVSALAARGAAVRALVFRPEQAPALRPLGAQQVLAGDLRDEAALARACSGVRAVYHLCPNVHPAELAIGRAVIAAARVAGVEHFVFHSVLHPQTEAMPHHWQKLRVEEALFEAGLPATILQPGPYMQNLLAGWDAIVRDGVYTVPYPLETRLSLVDLADVAAAAAVVLTEPGHLGATYELAGPEPLSQVEVAAVLARVLGREVVPAVQDLEVWERRARAAGLADYALSTLLAMFRYYACYGLVGNPNVLGWLLRRAPTSLGQWAAAQPAAGPPGRSRA